ncbi:exosortase/archaeosortase family protein [Horticoccus luteus]|uniref:Exosortase/archaeosortase family protein n=1 Tax=Horticoccus luteus TaxID=2862869 RepID=A0A8F9TU20_9BACT|nr:exosortase/archaeosortase family protein [Horticoccus luteus]QYM79066.1 exosortase/archaeosortase family protein [Horticoccus luteus]
MSGVRQADPAFAGRVLWLVALAAAALLLGPLSRAWALAPDLGHGWAAPMLIAYLWWERWPQRPGLRAARAVGAGSWVALGVCLMVALALRLLLTPYPLWPVAVIVYTALLIGLALVAAAQVAGAAGVRWLGGPLLVLIAVLPWPGAVERALILPVREAIASLVAEISNLAGHPALAAGTSVRLAGGWVGIDEACGGIRSLQAAVMTALFFGEWLRLPWRRRVVLIAAGGMAAVVGNFGRVLFLSWRAESGDLARWHDGAGWVALGFSLVVTGLVGWRCRSRAGRKAEAGKPGAATMKAQPPAPVVSKSVPTGILIWMVTAVVVLGGIEAGTRAWYARGKARWRTTVPQWTVRFPEANPTLRHVPLGESAREMLRPDVFASASWRERDQAERSANYIVWRTGQVARSAPFLHNPTICLPYSGCELEEELGVINVSWAHGEIPFHTYIFRRMDDTLLVAFALWDPGRGGPLQSRGGGWMGWWRDQWRDVREARQDQPAQLFSYAIAGRGGRDRLAKDLSALIRPVE